MPIFLDNLPDPASTVLLGRLFLNVADNPTDMQSFDQVGESLAPNTVTQVEVRQLMNRRRAIRTGTGDPAESMAVKLERPGVTQVKWLRDHLGVVICVRDHVGTKFFAVYKEMPREVATAWRDRISVSLQFDQVDFSEAV